MLFPPLHHRYTHFASETQNTSTRSNYVNIALRTAAMYPAQARVAQTVAIPPAYVDRPGFYEVDPNFPDTQQTTGELALLGIVACLAEKDVVIRTLKRKVQLLEEIIEKREVEEVEDLCGVEEGSADERSHIEEVWEEESTEERSSDTGGDAQSPSPSDTFKSGGRSRATRSDAVPLREYPISQHARYTRFAAHLWYPDERGMGIRTDPSDNAGEGSQQGPARWAGRKIERTVEAMAAKRNYSGEFSRQIQGAIYQTGQSARDSSSSN